MLSADRSKRLARVLVASGLDLSHRGRARDAILMLEKCGFVEGCPETWRDISRQVLGTADRLEAMAYCRLFAMLRVSGLRGLARISIARLQVLRPGSKCVASVLNRYLIGRIKNDQERKLKKERNDRQKRYIDDLIFAGKVIEIYNASDAVATKRLHNQLRANGADGGLAALMLIAQKASARAKKYRGKNRQRSYDRKLQAMDNLCSHLTDTKYRWGWGTDPEASCNWVLYVELPGIGQVSWHSPIRLDGPDSSEKWDGTHNSELRIIKFARLLLLANQSKSQVIQNQNCSISLDDWRATIPS